MRRGLVVLVVILTIGLPNLAHAWTVDVDITGRIILGDGSNEPLRRIEVQAWEADPGHDDYLGHAYTDQSGHFHFEMRVDDSNGLTSPEIYLKVRFSRLGSAVFVFEIHSEDHLSDVPVRRVTNEWSPPIQDDVAFKNFGDIVIDEIHDCLDFGRMYAFAEGELEDGFVASGLQVVVDRGSPILFGDHCLVNYFGSTELTWGWSEAKLISAGEFHFANIMCRAHALDVFNGGPPPTGATFTSVSTPEYAWDEGLNAFLAGVCPIPGTFPSAPGVPGYGLESAAVAVPVAQAASVPANVGAALWDLYDDVQDGDAAGHVDHHAGSLAQIFSVLETRPPVRTLAAFWNAWKTLGLPRHDAVQAIRVNGIDFNTPPHWDVPEATWWSPGDIAHYDFRPYVSDVESGSNQLQYEIQLYSSSSPITWTSSGGQLTSATISSSNGSGYAYFICIARDGIATVNSPIAKLIWTSATKDPPPEYEGRTPATERAGPPASLGLSVRDLSRGALAIELANPRAQVARLSVVDVTGRWVATLSDGYLGAGRHRVVWDGQSARGGHMPAGIYFLKLTTPSGEVAQKAVLVR